MATVSAGREAPGIPRKEVLVHPCRNTVIRAMHDGSRAMTMTIKARPARRKKRGHPSSPGDGTPSTRRSMSTNQILIGVGLIFVLAVGSQIVASRLHIPALIVMLPL